MSARYASASGPRPAAVSSRERYSRPARSPSSGCASAISACAQATPWFASGSSANAGDATPVGCTDEHESCTKPGSVSSALRHPPPGVELASNTTTLRPARARKIAAVRPLGPAPTTTASYSVLDALDALDAFVALMWCSALSLLAPCAYV